MIRTIQKPAFCWSKLTGLALFFTAMTILLSPVFGEDISVSGWRLWPDREAAWKDDTLYLPAEVRLMVYRELLVDEVAIELTPFDIPLNPAVRRNADNTVSPFYVPGRFFPGIL